MNRELRVFLRRKPEPSYNLEISDWLCGFNDSVLNQPSWSSDWYIEVFP